MDHGIQYKYEDSTSIPSNVNDETHSLYHLNVCLVVDDENALVKYSLDSLEF